MQKCILTVGQRVVSLNTRRAQNACAMCTHAHEGACAASAMCVHLCIVACRYALALAAHVRCMCAPVVGLKERKYMYCGAMNGTARRPGCVCATTANAIAMHSVIIQCAIIFIFNLVRF